MANGAVYSDEGDEIVIHDQKLDALEDMIEAANGRPVMVAYWFKHDLSKGLCEGLLKKRFLLKNWILRRASENGIVGNCLWH